MRRWPADRLTLDESYEGHEKGSRVDNLTKVPTGVTTASTDVPSAINAELLAALKEMREACCAAMRVVADLDTAHLIGIDAETRQQRFIDELKLVGVKNGFGVRADALIAKAEGRQ